MEENKRNRLLTSAYNLFIHKGINKTTIQDIVDAARVAKGTFYLYFEDKKRQPVPLRRVLQGRRGAAGRHPGHGADPGAAAFGAGGRGG